MSFPTTFARACAAAASLLAASVLAATDPVLGYDDARHLLARTGFGPTDAEVRAYAPLTRSAAAAKLLRETRTTAVTPAPASALDASPLRPPRGEASDAERKAFRDAQIRETLELRGWWIREMLVTPTPLTERMTLFWHNHFVSAQPKVRVARLMYRQNVTLRANALGSFGALLHAIAKNPAMLVYLDGVQNRKGAPNENFAREVMELFTLGEGHYGEQDVKEAARAFTGWSIERETGTFVFRPRLHDDGIKTVLGKSGNFDGDAVLDLLLPLPETAEFIVAKLWREFVSPDPDPAEVARIAKRFRDSGYEIKEALGSILASDAFYAPANRGVLVKSPVELVVGTLRPFAVEPPDGLPFAFAAAAMGQNLLAPPNVKGWPGGDAWINTSTLLARKAYLDRLTRADDAPMTAVAMERSTEGGAMQSAAGAAAIHAVDDEKARLQRFRRRMERGLANVNLDTARLLAQLPGATNEDRAHAAERLLLAVPPQRAPDSDADSAAFVRALLLDPAFQLK
jgi:uncharacterized protein (DUF1800 family)